MKKPDIRTILAFIFYHPIQTVFGSNKDIKTIKSDIRIVLEFIFYHPVQTSLVTWVVVTEILKRLKRGKT